MKTASELKIFKSNDYEYIYIYYKQNCLVRINTRYTTVKNGMTKGLLYKNTVPDYQKKNDHILLMKQRVDKYITNQLLSNSGSGEITQKDAHNAAFNIKPENSEDRKLLIPFFDSYFSKLNKENKYRPTTITYYNNLKARLEEYGTEVLKHKLYLADLNSPDSLIDFCNFLGEKRGMNDNSISKRLNSLKTFLEYCTVKKIYSYDPAIFSYKVKKYETGIVALSFDEL
jgi:hypothetical protein